MIVYDSKRWNSLFWTVFKTFKESYNQRQLLRFIIYAAVYASIITVVNIEFVKGAYSIDTMFFSLSGIILSLFLVFRLNTAYDRWWEGRKAWGKLVNDSRTFALNLNTIIPIEDRKRRKYFVRNIANFCIALKWHLRNDMKLDELIYMNRAHSEDLAKIKHVPNRIASYMFNEIELMYKEKAITDFDKQQTKYLLQGLIDVLGICERIKNTPIPFSHSTFIKFFILIYILVLPFGLVNAFQYLTIPATIIMSFAMLGVEIISEEIENPFGLDANDLPTGQLSDTIRENVYEILQVKSTFKSNPNVNVEAEVLH